MSKSYTIEITLDDFSTEELIEELEYRSKQSPVNNLVRIIYENRRLGKDYQKQLDDLIYTINGNII